MVVTAIAALALAAPPPRAFARTVDNPWFPLRPGSTYVYRGEKDGEASRDVVRVTHATRLIAGVRATAVSDRLFIGGRLEERTTDWYAQDRRGRVWYFGEATAELDRKGRVTSREGSWLAGVHGAQAGIFMPAHPAVGGSFRQEYLKGHAADHFSVLSVDARVRTRIASTTHGLLTKEWTPLEPGVVDHKLYIRGVGLAVERSITGGNERATLVSFRR